MQKVLWKKYFLQVCMKKDRGNVCSSLKFDENSSQLIFDPGTYLFVNTYIKIQNKCYLYKS